MFFFRFDANAPYTATALGITTQITRRPPNEWTLRNKNLANLYAGIKRDIYYLFNSTRFPLGLSIFKIFLTKF